MDFLVDSLTLTALIGVLAGLLAAFGGGALGWRLGRRRPPKPASLRRVPVRLGRMTGAHLVCQTCRQPAEALVIHTEGGARCEACFTRLALE